MGAFLDIALANLFVAALLALLASAAGLWGRRPAITHALWLLVFLKLITPPLFHVAIPWPEPSVPSDEPFGMVAPIVEEPAPLPLVPLPEPELPHEVNELPVVPEAFALEPLAFPELPKLDAFAMPPQNAPVVDAATAWPWGELVGSLWLAGSCVWLSLARGECGDFNDCFDSLNHAGFRSTVARELADCLRVRCPQVYVLPGNISPMLWTLGRTPRLFLPAGLLERLSPDQLATLLVHELAHWKRRDDRVRWLEIAVLAVYWWCPLVWWARRELHQAEEECCDAWVVAVLPEAAKTYALALVETVEFLSEAPADLPLVASGVGRVRLLKRRLAMILQANPRALTLTGMLGVAAWHWRCCRWSQLGPNATTRRRRRQRTKRTGVRCRDKTRRNASKAGRKTPTSLIAFARISRKHNRNWNDVSRKSSSALTN